MHLSQGDFFFLLQAGSTYCQPSGGAPTAIIAGRFSFDETHGRPLVDFLPPVILIRGDRPHKFPLRKTLELLASEVGASKSAAEPGPKWPFAGWRTCY